MKYLKKFENHNAYEAAQSGLILPNVSLCVQENEEHYNPSSPTPSYESINLGLPSGTLWAKYNVGATSETEYGNYYQWGRGSAQYAATSGQSDYEGEEDPLATSADIATQVWGGNWHMLTQTQLSELIANTTYEWTTINDVNGGKFGALDVSTMCFVLPQYGKADWEPDTNVIFYKDGASGYVVEDTGEFVPVDQFEDDEKYDDAYVFNTNINI